MPQAMTSPLTPTLIGVGTSGSRSVSSLKKKEVEGNYLIISDKSFDVVKGVPFIPYEGENRIENSIESFGGISVVFTSLAGNTGPYISPHLNLALKQKGNYVLNVAFPPFPYQENLYFKAANTLRRLKRAANLLLVVDNNFFKKKIGHIPLNEYYNRVNTRIAEVVRFILKGESLEEVRSLGDGVGVIIGVKAESISSAVAKVLANVYSMTGKVESSVAFIPKDPMPSPNELERIYRGLSLLDSGPPTNVRAIKDVSEVSLTMVAKTDHVNFERYDPVARILADRVLDDEPEVKLNVSLPMLERID